MSLISRRLQLLRILVIPRREISIRAAPSHTGFQFGSSLANSLGGRYNIPYSLSGLFCAFSSPVHGVFSRSLPFSRASGLEHRKRGFYSSSRVVWESKLQVQPRQVDRRGCPTFKKASVVVTTRREVSSIGRGSSSASPPSSPLSSPRSSKRKDSYEAREEEDCDDVEDVEEWDDEDSLLGENEMGSSDGEEGESGEEKKKVPRTNRGSVDRRHRSLPTIVVRKADIDKLDAMRIEVPEALHYKLHTMDSITDPIIGSIKTHTQLYMYAPSQEEFDLARECGELEEKLKTDVLGTCFYFRVIALPLSVSKETKEEYQPPTILTKCDMKPFVPLDKATGLTWELGSQTRGRKKKYCPFFLYHHPPPTPTTPPLTSAQRRAVDQIKNVLQMHFSTCVIEPIEGELACDVTLYAKYGALCEKAAIFAHQFNKDLDDILKEKNIREFQHYGKVLQSSGKEKVQPLTPEEVALRIAAFLKSTIFSGPLQSTEVSTSGEQNKKEENSLRVIFGIARTAVQAKLACDTEVAVVLQKHLEWQRQQEQGKQRTTEISKGKEQKRSSAATASPQPWEEQFICVRSFYKHFRTIDDEKKFIGSFELTQIPTVNHAFAHFMKHTFGIERVSQILEKKKELHFSLCRTTFDYCIRMGYGRMEFPHEVHTRLFSPSGKHLEEKVLEECAHNSITLLNENRTALRRNVPRLLYTMNSKQSTALLSLLGQKAYGRLVTNKKYVEAAMEAVLVPIGLLFENHCSTAALCVEDRRSSRRISWEAVSFPRTTNPLIILRVVRELAEKMAQRRVINDFDEEDDPYSICVRLFHLESYNLLPTALEESINAVVLAVKEACERRKEYRHQLRRILETHALERPFQRNVKAEVKTKGKKKDEVKKKKKLKKKI